MSNPRLNKITFIILISGIGLILTGFVYDMLFAGIPPQDPPPGLAKSYNEHAAIATLIVKSGVFVSFVGLIGILTLRIRMRRRNPIK